MNNSLEPIITQRLHVAPRPRVAPQTPPRLTVQAALTGWPELAAPLARAAAGAALAAAASHDDEPAIVAATSPADDLARELADPSIAPLCERLNVVGDFDTWRGHGLDVRRIAFNARAARAALRGDLRALHDAPEPMQRALRDAWSASTDVRELVYLLACSEPRTAVRAVVDLARGALVRLPDGASATRVLDTVTAWTRGDATVNDVERAASDAQALRAVCPIDPQAAANAVVRAAEAAAAAAVASSRGTGTLDAVLAAAYRVVDAAQALLGVSPGAVHVVVMTDEIYDAVAAANAVIKVTEAALAAARGGAVVDETAAAINHAVAAEVGARPHLMRSAAAVRRLAATAYRSKLADLVRSNYECPELVP